MKSVLIIFLLLLLLGCQQSPSGRDIQIRLSRIHETKDIPISELAKSYRTFTIPKECNPSDIRTISANSDMAIVTFSGMDYFGIYDMPNDKKCLSNEYLQIWVK